MGSALVEHPSIPVISFTGSTEAGRHIGARAGQLLKQVHLERGGNNALVVLGDVDVTAAASCKRASEVAIPAGRRLGALGAEHLKRVHLELGGNSALVMADVDLDRLRRCGPLVFSCTRAISA